MSNLVAALAATVLSMGVMWLVCLRPMSRHSHGASADPARQQVAALRREVAELRHRAGVR